MCHILGHSSWSARPDITHSTTWWLAPLRRRQYLWPKNLRVTPGQTESYIGDSATNAGSAAEAATTRKAAKYAGLERTHIFQPVAVENLGTMNASAYGFLAGLGQKISAISSDNRETCYLFQRISVLIQRFNATLLHESFADENRSDD